VTQYHIPEDMKLQKQWLSYPEKQSTTVPQNAGNYSPSDTVSHSRGHEASEIPMWEPKFWHRGEYVRIVMSCVCFLAWLLKPCHYHTYLLSHLELHPKQGHLSIYFLQWQQLLMNGLQLLLRVNSEPQHVATATLHAFHNERWAKFGLTDSHLTQKWQGLHVKKCKSLNQLHFCRSPSILHCWLYKLTSLL